ncbi:MAG: hypothetical protein EXR75_14340 [Myxococcales bacterium]|nr:hypothetical protein [Myxococcales bacterium]
MSDKDRKLAAMMLAALMTTDDEALEDFRKKRISRTSTLDVEQFRRMRELLHGLADVLRSDDELRWRQVSQASEAFNIGAAPTARASRAEDENTREKRYALPAPLAPPRSSAPQASPPPPLEHVAASGNDANIDAGPRVPFVLPFHRATAPTLDLGQFPTAMPLEAYAAAHALAPRHPALAVALFARYGATDESARELGEQHWRTRFAAEPQLYELFYVVFAAFEGMLDRHATPNNDPSCGAR